MIYRRTVAAGLLNAVGLAAFPWPVLAAPPRDARAIAKEAYLYAFAMMENYQTWYKQAVDTKAPEYVGGFGKYRHYSEPFTPGQPRCGHAEQRHAIFLGVAGSARRAICAFRAGGAEGPLLCGPMDRSLHAELRLCRRSIDRLGAGSYLIAGPKWHGSKPPGIRQVFQAETDIVGTLTRTALNGPEDVPNVRAIQAQYKLQPLSAFLGKPAPPPHRRSTFLPMT